MFKKYSEQLGLVGTWWSGQGKRVLLGIDGGLLVGVIGHSNLAVPVNLANCMTLTFGMVLDLLQSYLAMLNHACPVAAVHDVSMLSS